MKTDRKFKDSLLQKRHKTCGNCINLIKIKGWKKPNALCCKLDSRVSVDSNMANKCKYYKKKEYNKDNRKNLKDMITEYKKFINFN